MIEIVRYTPDMAASWDAFVGQSKNATFLFYRGYMDYHADRFADFSLMFYDKGRLCALMPANDDGPTATRMLPTAACPTSTGTTAAS